MFAVVLISTFKLSFGNDAINNNELPANLDEGVNTKKSNQGINNNINFSPVINVNVGGQTSNESSGVSKALEEKQAPLAYTPKKQNGFFVGLGVANLRDNYFYDKLEVSQYIGSQNAGQIINPPPLNSKECPAWFILENLDAFLTGNQASVNGIQVGVNPATPPTIIFGITIPGKPETPILSNCKNVKPQANTVAINQYIDINIKQSTSFSNSNSFKNVVPTINLGYKFNFGNFYYTPELFANYSKSKVKHLTFVPGQNFAGIASIDTGVIGIQQSVVLTQIDEVAQAITYSMPLDAGLISRVGYDFEFFSLNLISGGALTILNIDDGNIKDKVYMGRFIGGLGFEWKTSSKSPVTLYADYKFYIPLTKDIEREYDDKDNIGEKVKVKIKGFKNETASFEFGLKYYF